jgi:hypothetical protein
VRWIQDGTPHGEWDLKLGPDYAELKNQTGVVWKVCGHCVCVSPSLECLISTGLTVHGGLVSRPQAKVETGGMSPMTFILGNQGPTSSLRASSGSSAPVTNGTIHALYTFENGPVTTRFTLAMSAPNGKAPKTWGDVMMDTTGGELSAVCCATIVTRCDGQAVRLTGAIGSSSRAHMGCGALAQRAAHMSGGDGWNSPGDLTWCCLVRGTVVCTAALLPATGLVLGLVKCLDDKPQPPIPGGTYCDPNSVPPQMCPPFNGNPSTKCPKCSHPPCLCPGNYPPPPPLPPGQIDCNFAAAFSPGTLSPHGYIQRTSAAYAEAEALLCPGATAASNTEER